MGGGGMRLTSVLNPIRRLFDLRVRGFRLVEVVAAVVLAATIGFVYVAKTGAAEEADQIERLEGQIRSSQQRVRLLRAEVASLERPERIEALSEAAGLAPVAPDRQAQEADLGQLAAPDAPAIDPEGTAVLLATDPAAAAPVDDEAVVPGVRVER